MIKSTSYQNLVDTSPYSPKFLSNVPRKMPNNERQFNAQMLTQDPQQILDTIKTIKDNNQNKMKIEQQQAVITKPNKNRNSFHFNANIERNVNEKEKKTFMFSSLNVTKEDANLSKVQTAGVVQKRFYKQVSLTKQPSKIEIAISTSPQDNKMYFPDLVVENNKSSLNIQKKRFQKQREEPPETSFKQRSTNVYGMPTTQKFVENSSLLSQSKNEIRVSRKDNLNMLPILHKPVVSQSLATPYKMSVNYFQKQLNNDKQKTGQTPKVNNKSGIKLQPLNNESTIDVEKLEALKLLKLGFVSQKGQSTIYKKQQNQDSFVIKKNLLGKDNNFLLAVADGHGTNGHLVSGHIKKQLVQIFEFEDKRLARHKLRHKNIESIFDLDFSVDDTLFREMIKTLLDKVFQQVNRQLEAQISFDIQLSGSTLVLAIINKNYLITANCGDSRCIVFNEQGSIILETIDHKPERPDEKQRIECQFKGKVRKSRISHSSSDNKEEVAEISDGPYRVYSQIVDLPGLAMSRSIGDGMAKSLGVIPDPEIQIIPFKDVYGIALASDGIWDVIESQGIPQLIKEIKDKKVQEENGQQQIQTKDIAFKVLQEANRRWRDLPQNKLGINSGSAKSGLDIDDITFVIGLLNEQQNQ